MKYKACHDKVQTCPGTETSVFWPLPICLVSSCSTSKLYHAHTHTHTIIALLLAFKDLPFAWNIPSPFLPDQSSDSSFNSARSPPHPRSLFRSSLQPSAGCSTGLYTQLYSHFIMPLFVCISVPSQTMSSSVALTMFASKVLVQRLARKKHFLKSLLNELMNDCFYSVC